MNFEQAVIQMQNGSRVARKSWNGAKYMYADFGRIFVQYSDGKKTAFYSNTAKGNDWDWVE